MSEPLVSVLVPTYNGERFLAEALASALGQTHRRLEVLVGDDASTDGTAELLAGVAEADPRVRVIRHGRNVGAFENPVRLLEAARGEYVKYLLHDDVLAPDCVETLVAGMQAAPDVSLAFSHRTRIDEDGNRLPADATPLLTRTGLVDGTSLGDAVLEYTRNVVGELTTCLFRRSDVDPAALWRVDGVQLAANGDVALWLGLLAGRRAFYTERPLSSFRVHGGQRSASPALVAAGTRDWPLLIDWGRRLGYLADPAREYNAHAEVLRTAAQVHAALPGSPDGALALEAAFLATARLAELRSGAAGDLDRPLAERAHGPRLLGTLAQGLDVLARVHPFAVAAPRPDAGEVAATVGALRDVAAAGVAQRLVLAVDPADVAAVVPLVEAALAEGSDVDVELVPTDDPASLVPAPWLAVAPPGRSWHVGRAAAVWSVRAG
ncbi:glycosyltransferase family 2 protein [Geodermatophilus nigrescens]|uniref:Glycosyl transferase family 2 n=1 Tax=Geodermatophilus nigrescens TaxID=1070870 RepID=A0A1M5ECC6_9ACTN|nr:glycosyltransferase [Geodermatophilus nigrescens]SHF76899.1 Glycosyl transferase family 2 [Geodermatophilus nigrescens]